MAIIYESLLLFAVLFLCSLIYSGAASASLTGWSRHAFQFYLFIVAGIYFIFCWLRGGQTLAMKTWKLQLVTSTNLPITPSQALLRYVLASASLLFAGLGFLWALIDKDGLFLHDRLAGTCIVKCA